MSNLILPPNRNSPQWLRFFPYERRNWRKVIAESELPDEAKNLIHHVIKKSRLMRFEKIEVIHELIGHFLDGELAGKSYSQMVASFGDPQTTATLVRRSKIRNRPVMIRFVQIIGWMILGILSIYLGIYGYFHSATPTLSHDYLADLNALNTDIAEDDQAWPIYRKAWIEFGFSEDGEFRREFRSFFYVPDKESGIAFPPDRLIKPTDERWPEAVAKLKEITTLLDAFRAGASKPRLGLELQQDVTKYSDEDFEALFAPASRDFRKNSKVGYFGSDDPTLAGNLIGVLLPHLQPFREAARILKVDTYWAVEQGDAERVVRNMKTFMGLSSHAADSNVLVGSLVGFAISGIGFETLEEVLTADPDFFTDDQLQRLMNHIGGISFAEMTRFEGERAMIMDIIQRTFSDDGNGNGRITASGIKSGMALTSEYSNSMTKEAGTAGRIARFAQNALAPVSLFIVADRKDTTETANRFIDEFTAAVAQPMWDRPEVEFEDFLHNNQMKYFLLEMLMPAFDAVISATDRMTGRQEGILAALAAHRYRLAHHQWPTELIHLAPDFVAELPVDILNGNDLRLTQDDQGLVVYSVGWDKDDDGGVQTTDQQGNLVPAANFVGGSTHTNDDGDWILWPQVRYNERGPATTD